jgi:hypothetical protein
MNTLSILPRSVLPALALALACIGPQAHAKGKDQPDSYSGHGAAADRWLIKGTDTVANCGGPVGKQTNGATGGTVNVCRVDGVIVEVEKAPDPKPKPMP